jgi:hypothetical protein
MGVPNPGREELLRLEAKTLDAQFLTAIQKGLNCSPFESHAVLEVVKEVYFPVLGETAPPDPGKLCVVGVCADEPAGKQPAREQRLRERHGNCERTGDAQDFETVGQARAGAVERLRHPGAGQPGFFERAPQLLLPGIVPRVQDRLRLREIAKDPRGRVDQQVARLRRARRICVAHSAFPASACTRARAGRASASARRSDAPNAACCSTADRRSS